MVKGYRFPADLPDGQKEQNRENRKSYPRRLLSLPLGLSLLNGYVRRLRGQHPAYTLLELILALALATVILGMVAVAIHVNLVVAQKRAAWMKRNLRGPCCNALARICATRSRSSQPRQARPAHRPHLVRRAHPAPRPHP